MDYLARESAPFSPEVWEKIDAAVVEAAKKHLVCRRFLNLHGPLGSCVFAVPVDSPSKAEDFKDGIGRITGRKIVELPQLYEDFSLLWRDIEACENHGRPLDLSPAKAAGGKFATREDELILFGNKTLGTEGIFNAKGAYKIKRGNWKEGEQAFQDIAKGVAYLAGKGMVGRRALVLSPEVYLDLQRILPSTGLLELDRIAKLVDNRVYSAGPFGAGKAALVYAEPNCIDFAVGVDLSVAYLELKDLNHSFRVLETAALRIKNPEAIVLFE